MLEQYFVPEYMMNSFLDLTPEFLECIGAKAVIAEIDNTLSAYDEKVPDEKVKAWIAALIFHGIRVAIVSNSDENRVRKYCESLFVPACADAKKPSVRAITSAMKKMGSDPGNTVIIGSRLLVDVFVGRRLGITTVAVKPIKQKNDRRSKLEQSIEKRYVTAYQLIKSGSAVEF